MAQHIRKIVAHSALIVTAKKQRIRKGKTEKDGSFTHTHTHTWFFSTHCRSHREVLLGLPPQGCTEPVVSSNTGCTHRGTDTGRALPGQCHFTILCPWRRGVSCETGDIAAVLSGLLLATLALICLGSV